MANYWDKVTNNRMARRRLLRSGAALSVGAAALALVGCGDDDPSGGATSAPGSTSAPGATSVPDPTPTEDTRVLSEYGSYTPSDGPPHERITFCDLARGPVSDHLDFHRDGRSGTAARVHFSDRSANGPMKQGVDHHEPLLAFGAHVDLHGHLEGNRVHRSATGDDAHIVTRFRAASGVRVRGEIEVMGRPTHYLRWVQQAEGTPRVPTGAGERDQVTV